MTHPPRRDGGELGARRRQALHHQRGRRRRLHRVRATATGRASRRSWSQADDPGFAVGRIEPKMGIKGSTTGELHFDGCRIPADRLLGERGRRLPLAMRVLDRSRPGSPHRRWGSRRPRSTTPPSYATDAIAFGKPIAAPAGHPVHAGRHGDRGRGGRGLLYRWARCSTPATTARADASCRRWQAAARTPPWRSPPTPCRSSAATATCRSFRRAADARRQDHPDLRGHQPDPAVVIARELLRDLM